MRRPEEMVFGRHVQDLRDLGGQELPEIAEVFIDLTSNRARGGLDDAG